MSRRTIQRQIARAEQLFKERHYSRAAGIAFTAYHNSIVVDFELERKAWKLFAKAGANAENRAITGPFHIVR